MEVSTRILMGIAATTLSAALSAAEPRAIPVVDASPVGQWTCVGAATQANGQWQATLALYANGTWQMQEAIAPVRNMVGTMVRANGRYQQTGPGTYTLMFSQFAMSADGTNWMTPQTPPPMGVQLQGQTLVYDGTPCHRSA